MGLAGINRQTDYLSGGRTVPPCEPRGLGSGCELEDKFELHSVNI